MKRITVASLSASAAVLLLAGCASTMVPKDTRQDDSKITSVVEASLVSNDSVKGQAVEVQTREGIIYLMGVVDTAEARREASRLAWRAEGVEGVVNNLTVGDRTAGSWADDVMISSKVKAQLIGKSEIRASDIDVSSSQGVVTLIGRVSDSSIKDDAERIARATNGVTDVNNELLVGKIGR